MDTELNIKEENESSEDEHNQKYETADNIEHIETKEFDTSTDNKQELHPFEFALTDSTKQEFNQFELVKCESVSDNEQDVGSSSTTNQKPRPAHASSSKLKLIRVEMSSDSNSEIELDEQLEAAVENSGAISNISEVSSSNISVKVNNNKRRKVENPKDVDAIPHVQKNKSFEKLKAKCAQKVHLDKEFFYINFNKSSPDGLRLVVICVVCEKVLKGSIKVSSNFLGHLKKQHPEKYASFLKKKGEGIQNAPLEYQSYTQTHRCSQELFEVNVAKYVISSFAPLSTVEDPRFRKIFDDLRVTKGNRSYLHHVRRAKLVQNISRIFEETMADIKTALGTIKYICTTADIWSSNKRSFLGVTAHWINPETLIRESAAIACRRFPGSLTYDTVEAMLNAVHDSFFDSKCLVATVTDNTSNFVKAFKIFGLDSLLNDADNDDDSHDFGDILEENQRAEEPEIYLPTHLRCAAHTLNLISTTDLKKELSHFKNLEIMHAITISRCTVLWNQRNEIIHKVLGAALKRPVVTQWNSLYEALKYIASHQDKIVNCLYSELCIDEKNRLSNEDFEYINEYCLCLRPVAETLNYLQGETYAFYGVLTPALVSLRFKTQAILNTRLKYCEPIVKGILKSLDNRFANFFNITEEGEAAAVAASLHPTFKLKWLTSFSAHNKLKVQKLIQKALTEINPDALTNKRIPEPGDAGFFVFDDSVVGSEAETLPKSCVVTQYLESPTTPDINAVKFDSSVLELFIKFNTALPSSAAIERVFSYSTMLNVAKYNRLSDDNFEKRVLLKANSNYKLRH